MHIQMIFAAGEKGRTMKLKLHSLLIGISLVVAMISYFTDDMEEALWFLGLAILNCHMEEADR